MSYRANVIAGGAAAVLVFDAVAAVASRHLGFPYAVASIGSGLIYLAIGFLAARGSVRSPVRYAATTAAIAGFVDASAGWAISSKVGVGESLHRVSLTPARWVATAILVVLLAAAVGALGGIAGRRRGRIHVPTA